MKTLLLFYDSLSGMAKGCILRDDVIIVQHSLDRPGKKKFSF